MRKNKPKIEESRLLQTLPRKDFLAAALLSTFAFLVYAFTAAPGITMEDSGDFMSGVITLGIVHPPAADTRVGEQTKDGDRSRRDND